MHRYTLKIPLALSLITLTALFAYINFNTPIVGDAWGPRTFGLENNDWFPTIKGYLKGYYLGNPRIGQMGLIFSGYHPNAYAILISVVSTVYVLLLGALVVGEKSFTKPFTTFTTGLIALAITWYIDKAIGPIFFYQATSSNYLIATVLLLSFLLVYRIGLANTNTPPVFKNPIFLSSFGLLALAAGMAHEIFGPATIFILLLFLVVEKKFYVQRSQRWQIIGTIGYVLGWALIFFSPGQDHRYTKSRFDGIPSSWDELLGKTHELIILLIGNGLGLAIVTIGIAFVFLPVWRQFAREFATVLVALSLSIGFVFTAIASPLLGERLAFASHSLMAIAATVILTQFFHKRHLFTGLVIVATSYLAVEYVRALDAYRLYKSQFERQAKAVEESKASGNMDVVAPAYSVPFYDLKKYVYREFPQKGENAKVNRIISRYYRIKSFSVSPPDSLVEFSKIFLGTNAVLRLDENCPSWDRNSWTGAYDPMGSLVCGETYTVNFDPIKETWLVTGIREVSGKAFSLRMFSHETKGPPPKTGELRIWGGAYWFDDQGSLYSSRNVRVGHILSKLEK